MAYWEVERTCTAEGGSVLMETSAEVTQAARDLGLLPGQDGTGPRHTGIRILSQNGMSAGYEYAIWADGRIVSYINSVNSRHAYYTV